MVKSFGVTDPFRKLLGTVLDSPHFCMSNAFYPSSSSLIFPFCQK